MASDPGGGPDDPTTVADGRVEDPHPVESTGELTDRLTGEELRRLARGHARRVVRLDPLIPMPTELLVDEPAAADVAEELVDRPGPESDHAPEGTLLSVRADDSVAAGRWTSGAVDATDYAASFSWLHPHRLRVGLDGPDRAAALSLLLDRWLERLRPLCGDDPTQETGATITWPARDVHGVAELTRHGFSPEAVLAARPAEAAPRRENAGDDHLEIRPARLDDVDTVVALHLEELLFDDLLGGLHLRSSIERAVRSVEVAALSRNDGSRILALRDGVPVGLIALSPPAEAGWVAELVVGERVGYIDCLSVTEQVRGTGVGPRLVQAATDRLADDRIDVTLLHHSPVNPYSAPFWARAGFRPLWLHWSRRLTAV